MQDRGISEVQAQIRAKLGPVIVGKIDALTDSSIESYQDTVHLLAFNAARETQLLLGGITGRKIVGVKDTVEPTNYKDVRASIERMMSSIALKAFVNGFENGLENAANTAEAIQS